MASYTQYETAHGKRWQAIWRDQNHRQHHRRGFARKTDAQKWYENNITIPQATGQYIAPITGSYTVNQAWKAVLTARQATWKPFTLQQYTICYKLHIKPAIGSKQISRITRNDIQQLLNSYTGHPGTARTAYNILKLIWGQAKEDNKIISTMPVDNIRRPRNTQATHHYLTMSQLIKVANIADSKKHGHHGLQVLTLGLSGIRWGESVALRAEDIDTVNSIIHVRHTAARTIYGWQEDTPKNGKTRNVPIPQQLTKLLEEHVKGKQPQDLVFPPTRNAPYQSPPSTWWHASLKEAGIPPMPIHSLRHTAASLAVASGADIKVIQSMLGHSSAAMTLDVYADLFTGRDRMAADRLGAMFDEASRGNSVVTKRSTNPR